jgi:hypothetical protein
MRSLAPATALFLAIAACTASPEANLNQTIGTANYDRSDRRLWVSGQQYIIPPNMNTTGLQSGDRVRVSWQEQGGQRVLTRWRTEQRRSDRGGA